MLHATRGRPQQALKVRDHWLSNSDGPNQIEYIFACNITDQPSVSGLADYAPVITPHMEGVTAVANWNAAAAVSKGDVLLVIADDLYCKPKWDSFIRGIFESRLDQPWVLMLGDRDQIGAVMRHPCVNRRYYEKIGYIFYPEYRGVYADNDFTLEAICNHCILDGRELELEHHNPFIAQRMHGDFSNQPDAVTQMMNEPEEYKYGKNLFERRQEQLAAQYGHNTRSP